MVALLLSTAMAATLAPGTPLDNAAALHVSQTGLANLGEAISQVVPETIDETLIEGEFECDAGDASPLSYAIHDMTIGLNAKSVDLVASDGRLDLTVVMAVSLYASDVEITGDCTFLFSDLDQSCGMEITEDDAINVTLHIGIAMALTDEGVVDATVDDVSYVLDPIPNPLHDCGFATVVDALLGLNDEFLNDLIATFLDPTLADLGPTIETALEDALGSLNLETSVDVLGNALNLGLYPSELTLSDSGLFLGFGATASIDEITECTDVGDGSPVNSDGWPATGETAWDEGGLPYDAALLLNKDFVDHLLWNVWATGVFCSNVADLADLPLDSDFLGGLYGEDWEALFPVSQPVELTLEDDEQPTGRFGSDYPLFIDINNLGINTASVLDARMTRVCQTGINGWIALDAGITTSEIAPELVIDTEAFEFSDAYSELLGAGYSQGIANLLPTVLSSFLPEDLLPVISVPTWQGIGIKTVVWDPTDDGQWQGGFITLDTDNVEPLEIAGCSGCTDGSSDPLGCSDTSAGCDSGCSGGGCTTSGKGQTSLGVFASLFALILVRRRR